MSLLSLPVELLDTILTTLVHPRWPDFGPESRAQVFALKSVCKKLNVLTTYIAFNQLQLREEYGLLRGPRAAWFTLLAREKERGGHDNAMTRMILRLRDAVGRELIKRHEVEERYVAAFVDATICYMGGRETYIHLLEEDILDEATFFGARLGGVDMLMVAAVQLRDMELIRLLATTGEVGVRPGSKVYTVAQYLACLKGDLGMLQLVRGLGNPHPNVPSGYLGNAMKAAIWSGNAEIVNEMISCGADVNTLGVSHGPRPLSAATRLGHVVTIKQLLAAGAYVTAGDDEDDSALCAAATAQSPSARNKAVLITKLLLIYGCGHNGIREAKTRALYAAVREGNAELVRILLDDGVDPEALFGSSGAFTGIWRSGSVEIAKLFMKLDADAPERRLATLTTLLNAAIQYRKSDLAKFFIGQMTDAEIYSSQRWFIMQSVMAGCVGALEALVERRVPVQIRGENAWERLARSYDHDNNQTINILKKMGVKPNYDLFRVAVENGRKDLVTAILERHADIVQPLIDGHTRISFLSQVDISIVTMLLNAGIRFDPKTAGRFFCTAVSVEDYDTAKRVVNPHAGIEIKEFPYVQPWEPKVRANDLVWIHRLRTNFPVNHQHALRLLGSRYGPDLVSVARLLEGRRIPISHINPFLAIERAIKAEDMPLLLFFWQWCDTTLISSIQFGQLLTSANTRMRKFLCDRWELKHGYQHPNDPAQGTSDVPWGAVASLHLLPRTHSGWAWPKENSFIIIKSKLDSEETRIRMQMARGYQSIIEKEGAVEVLHQFIKEGNVLMVQILLEFGVDVDTPMSRMGYAHPLEMAERLDDRDMVRLLLDARGPS